MSTIETIMEEARQHVRDFPQFFRATVAHNEASRFVDLKHRNVMSAGLEVKAVGTSSTVVGATAWEGDPPSTHFVYSLDEREGVIQIVNGSNIPADSFINVAGYFFDWLANQDLHFHTTNIIAEHQFEVPEWDVSNISDIESNVLSLGVAVDALVALLVEFSRDIDIATPEAITVPATQRFRQLQQLLYGPEGLVDRYKHKAAMTGTGLDRARMHTLRRVSATTNRLVPVYENREYDDLAWPQRVFPPITPQGPHSPGPGFIPARRLRNPASGGGPNP